MKLSLLCLLGLAGCMDDIEVLDTGEIESEIVGGTLTNARPEIGQYSDGSGTCTATLIGPQLVLTAAHCLFPQYTAAQPGVGAQFSFTDSSGQPRQVPADRVHSFGTRRFERPFGGSAFTTDVALVHLMWPVPPSQAIPSPIAAQEPINGQLSTIFGFGCTRRDPRVTDNRKRIFTFNYGQQTRALCWGDSGGPVVYGDLLTQGAVWGTNSDFDLSSVFPNSWVDLFGDVPIYKKQIEDIARSWDQGLELGMDRFGFDYATDIAPTAAACKTICQRDGNCRAFTWRQSDQLCWRKSAASEPSPGWGLVSGLPSRIEPGIDRLGGDYAAFNHSTPDACNAQCGRDPNCQSWTQLGNMCWLKGSVPAASLACPGCTSGVVRRGFDVNVDRPGSTFQTTSSSTPAQCAAACTVNSRCEAYVHQGFTCFLKDSVPNAVPVSPGSFTTSGVRRGVETNTDRPGVTYANRPTPELSPNACQVMCAAESQCQSWTYSPPDASTSLASCALRSNVPQRQTAQGKVSGIKGLEMLP